MTKETTEAARKTILERLGAGGPQTKAMLNEALPDLNRNQLTHVMDGLQNEIEANGVGRHTTWSLRPKSNALADAIVQTVHKPKPTMEAAMLRAIELIKVAGSIDKAIATLELIRTIKEMT